MWSLVFTLQYICIICWIVINALGTDISLSRTFIPLFLIVLVVNLFYAFINGRIKIFNFKYFFIILTLIIISIFTSIINYFRLTSSIDIVLYSFIIPFTLFFCQLAVWILPISDKRVFSVIKVLKFFFIINALITTIFFFLINIFQIIDLDIVWDLSIQNTVLMSIGGYTWYRTPGIFEIGGTNGTFLLMFVAMGISKLYYSNNRINSSKYSLYIFLTSTLIFFTLTRRTYLCLISSLIILFSLKNFKNFSISKILLFTLSILVIIIGLFVVNINFEGIFSLDSLYDRLQFWYYSINHVIGNNIVNLFIGKNVLQSALNQSIMSIYTNTILDNGFIECIMHAGIIFTLIFIVYIGLLLRDNLKLINLEISEEFRWIPLFNILMIINMFILMIFSTFIYNLTESFVYLFLINYLTKYLLDNEYKIKKL